MEIDNREIPICFACDQSYLQHFYVALLSFLETNPGGHTIYLFHEKIDDQTINEAIQFTKSKFPESTLIGMPCNPTKIQKLKGQEDRLGNAALIRLQIPNMLPEKYSHALYLDVDLVITGELNFSCYPINDFTILAVKDPSSDIFAPKREIEKMFNSGVLLINTTLWKSNNVDELIASCNPKLTRLADQELLNAVFDRNWYELPANFNVNALELERKAFKFYGKNGNRPVVIHFMGSHKPWRYLMSGSFLYWKYVLHTPFKRNFYKIMFLPINSLVYSIQFRIKLFFKKRNKQRKMDVILPIR